MTITTRAVKGAPLTNAELDANFTDLRDLKAPQASPQFTNTMSLASGVGSNAYCELAGNGNAVGGASMLFGQDSASSGYVWNRANAAVFFATNSVERMRVSQGGNLLIGTTIDDGSSKLQVSGTATITGRAYVTGTFGGAAGMALTNTTANSYGVMQLAGTGVAGGGQVSFYYDATASGGMYGDATGVTVYAATSTFVAKFAASGNLLIGTSTDVGGYKLRVEGGGYFASAVTAAAFTSVTGGITTNVGADALGSYLESVGANNLRFYAGSSERVRITPTGNLLVGTTTDNGADKLQVAGSVKTTGALSVGASVISLGTVSLWPSSGGGAGSFSIVRAATNALTIMNDYSGIEALRITAAGQLLIGNTVAVWDGVVGRGLVELNGANNALIGLKVGGTAAGYLYHTGTDLSLFNQRAGDMYFSTNSVERVRIDASGNLLVGATSGSYHTILKPGAENTTILLMGGNQAGYSYFSAVGATAGNGAATALYLGRNTTTLRSLNAGGTINASGADYAEYMRKADTCGDIAKGQVVGVDADGLLTDKWDEAISFMVKTTNPSYVGGDTWGNDEALGITKPTDPEHETYTEDLAAHEAALELARSKVDRIAYAGQVPVNVTGAKPGQYIVPARFGDIIGGVVMNLTDMDMQQYARAVGIVQNILPDGRANIRVKVA